MFSASPSLTTFFFDSCPCDDFQSVYILSLKQEQLLRFQGQNPARDKNEMHEMAWSARKLHGCARLIASLSYRSLCLVLLALSFKLPLKIRSLKESLLQGELPICRIVLC